MSPRPRIRTWLAPWRTAGGRAIALVLLLALLAGIAEFAGLTGSGVAPSQARESRDASEAVIHVDALPPQARRTLQLIRQGGPFPYARDGTVFGNRERLLPRKPRGYYTEYTVPTPHARDRGARRIVAGGERGRFTEFYYTDDHYASFRRIIEPSP
jgi:ribonuclease T1